MLNKGKYLLIIPIISVFLLVVDKMSGGFIDFYLSKNLILLLNLLVFSITFYRNEQSITRKVQEFKYTKNLLFLSKFTFLLSGIVLAVKYLQPIIYLLADKSQYYGYFYQLYNKYFFAFARLDTEAIVLLLFSLVFIATAQKKNLKTNNSDIDKSEAREESDRVKSIKKNSSFYKLRKLFVKEGLFYSITLTLLITIFLVFGTIHLGEFMTVDEPKWFENRVPDFYESIVEEDWAGTYTNDKPGVLPAILSNTINLFTDRATLEPTTLSQYLFWWRLPLVILGALSLIPIYHFTKKLFNKNVAILATAMIGLSPTIVGMSQVVNPDATLWSTAFLTFVTFMLYMKTNKQRYLFISGLFFGLALISKYFISIFYILYFAIIYLEYLTNQKDPRIAIQRYIDLGKLVLISVVFYTIFFPATWFDYRQIIVGTLGSEVIQTGFPFIVSAIGLIIGELVIFNGRVTTWIARKFDLNRIILYSLIIGLLTLLGILTINTLSNYKFFNLDSFLWVEFQRRSADILKTFGGSLYTTFFVLTLPTIAGIFITFWTILKKQQNALEDLTVNSSMIIILLFIAGSAIGGFIATARYQVMLIPLYILVASLGITKLKNVRVLLTVFGIASVLTIWSSAPFYLTFENGLNRSDTVINDPWGIGAYELAQKMNTLPNAKDITIWADREGFNEFFIGKTYWRGKDNPFDKNLGVDYLILSIGGERIYNVALQKYKNEGEGDIYSRMALQTPLMKYYSYEPDFEFCIDKGRNNCIRAVRLTDKIDY